MISGIISGIVSGIIVLMFGKKINDYDNFQTFTAILTALKNELKYNRRHRGIPKSPFQLTWLEKALNNHFLYEYCEEIAAPLLEVYELAKDANTGNIEKRKYENGISYVPGTIQEKMEIILNKIEEILPKIKKISFLNFIIKGLKRAFFNFFLKP